MQGRFALADGSLPGAGQDHIRDIFGRMGFNDREMVNTRHANEREHAPVAAADCCLALLAVRLALRLSFRSL